ncbi:MAG: hypothetical protein P8Y69_01580 [Gammaproteobacteria bacterium]
MRSMTLLKRCLFVSVFFSGMAGAASDEAAPTLRTIPPDRAANISAALDALLNEIDRSQFDLDALLDALDYNEDKIIDFVAEEIAYDDYTGVLRGSKGTLVSRAGNSLDQSILLAHLLKEAGLDARIVRATAPSSLMRSLLLSERAPPPPVFRNLDVVEQAGARLARPDGVGRRMTDGERQAAREAVIVLPGSLTGLATDIHRTLPPMTGQASGPSGSGSLEQVPYFWVEYRLGQSDPWDAAHPALGGKEAPPDVAPEGYMADSVGSELQQRIRVQAFIERSRNGKLESEAVTKQYEYPAANLSGVTFSYSVIPSAFLASGQVSADQSERMLTESALFFPVLDFGGGNLDLAFDTIGNVLSAQDTANAMAPLFQNVGKGFLSAADALNGDSANGLPSMHVTRHWIEITLLRPGMEPKVFTRDIARWQGDEALFRKSLARVAYFRVEAGSLSPAEVLERSLSMQRDLMRSLTSGTPLALDEGTLAQFSLDTETFLLASDMVAKQNETARSYRAEPAIVARYLPYGRIDASREGFAIISSPRVAIRADGATPDAQTTLYNGIVDTWLENELFADEQWSRSAYGRLQQRLDAGGELTVLNDRSDRLLAQIPSPAGDLVQKDLEENQRVVLVGPAGECDAWWRVDPVSGAAVGVLANGWGGVIPEYLQELAVIHGKMKIASLAAGCGLTVPFITAGAAINAMGLFELDEALGFVGMDLCSHIPEPNLQSLCTLTVTSLSMASAAGAAESGLSTAMLVRICVMSAL